MSLGKGNEVWGFYFGKLVEIIPYSVDMIRIIYNDVAGKNANSSPQIPSSDLQMAFG